MKESKRHKQVKLEREIGAWTCTEECRVGLRTSGRYEENIANSAIIVTIDMMTVPKRSSSWLLWMVTT
jgi:hypothetical protein